ncbi:hypothetical protein E2562_009645 [Oryza meyeriana var. granulata]|uniref:Uncharacterized protein n=1 Tax=Oryza meyeriana var. granulata TaxID=110450 RepID=A0A6G1D0N9_9ORYZ|nr:hypothetical protein E2562_009645 [Oryza meyeriana var. granulata]
MDGRPSSSAPAWALTLMHLLHRRPWMLCRCASSAAAVDACAAMSQHAPPPSASHDASTAGCASASTHGRRGTHKERAVTPHASG